MIVAQSPYPRPILPPGSAPAPTLAEAQSSSLRFTWAAVTGATGYRVALRTLPSGVFGAEQDVGTALTVTFPGLVGATDYEVRVVAYNSVGDSPPGTAQAQTLAPPQPFSAALTEDFEDAALVVTFEAVSGAAAWALDTGGATGRSGVLASVDIGDLQVAAVDVAFTADVPGQVQFDHFVSSESSYDFLTVDLDGARVVQRSGSSGWQTYTSPVLNGEHRLRIAYRKDGSVSAGLDLAAIDNFAWVPEG